jgi:hypothetical protein
MAFGDPVAPMPRAKSNREAGGEMKSILHREIPPKYVKNCMSVFVRLALISMLVVIGWACIEPFNRFWVRQAARVYVHSHFDRLPYGKLGFPYEAVEYDVNDRHYTVHYSHGRFSDSSVFIYGDGRIRWSGPGVE